MKRYIVPVCLIVMTMVMSIIAWYHLSSRGLMTPDTRTRLEDSIIIRDIEMESDEPVAESDAVTGPEGHVVYDDLFSRDQAVALRDGERRLSGKKQFETLKKGDKRWHLVKYTIKKNDNLWKIARRNGLSHDLIIGINEINRPDMLSPGKVIEVPSRRGIYYTVKKGDTLTRIAHEYRVSPRLISEQNHVASQRLKADQRLFLPGAVERPVQHVVSRQKPHRDAPAAFPAVKKTEPAAAPVIAQHVRFAWPLSGRITSGFGNRRDPFSGKRSFHCGIDIGANAGLSIKAAADGRVIFSGWKPGYGNVVIIRHDDGYITVYAHNSRNVVAEETRVQRGELIAYTGNTGAVTGSHLHFEIRKGVGFPLNPLRLLQ